MITPDDFFADDIYPKWNDMIKMSINSIKIFTPYLDKSIINLLDNRPQNIEVKIITRIDGETIFEKAYQLNAIKSLIAMGYEVKNCELLHAKVLLVDDEILSVGSQNFTFQGRKNKEASYISKKSFISSKFIEDLNNWEHQAKIIDSNLINELLEYLIEFEPEILNIREKVSKGIDNIIINYEEINNLNFHHLSNPNNYVYRFAQGEVILTKTVPPPDYSYYSYFASESNDLCQWIVQKENKEAEIMKLTGYEYYTSFNLQTHELKFVRIHSSRITFTIKSFTVAEWKGLELLDQRFSITFNYLNKNTFESNIEIKLKNQEIGSIRMRIYFDGKELKLVAYEADSDKCEIFMLENLINQPNRFKQFVIEQMKPYPFTTSKDAPKDIEKFLGDYKYTLRITTFSDCPILVFDKV